MNMRNGRYAAVALAALVAMGVAGCGSTHGKTETLKLTEPGGHAGTFAPIGKATQQRTPAGSGFAFSTPLESSGKQRVGTLYATCIAAQPSKGNGLKGTCSGTAVVSGGTLALSVGGNFGPNVSGAITGGTGKYAGATGTFESAQSGSNGPSHDTFNVTLP
jgi:hypothetical protein